MLLVLFVVVFGLVACAQAPAATQAPAKEKITYQTMTMCYPQFGAESDWRTANTASFKETAGELGVRIDLL